MQEFLSEKQTSHTGCLHRHRNIETERNITGVIETERNITSH